MILGIESTAHTFGMSILDSNGTILENLKDTYSDSNKGMIPHLVVEHHEKFSKLFSEKLKKYFNEINYVVYSAGPGIDPILWFGYNFSKDLAEKLGAELIGANHCRAHLSIGKHVNSLKDPVYLYVSGVNCQVIIEEGNSYKVLGETLDIGIGNCLDKFARVIGLGFPGGPLIENMAKSAGEILVELPYVVKGMDVSFSGPLTKATQLFENKKYSAKDLAFSLQEYLFSMMAEVSERALALTGKKELLVVGGVAANSRFREMLSIMCKDRGAKLYVTPLDLCGDQGAMIGWEGYITKDFIELDFKVNPYWRVDE